MPPLTPSPIDREREEEKRANRGGRREERGQKGGREREGEKLERIERKERERESQEKEDVDYQYLDLKKKKGPRGGTPERGLHRIFIL